MNTQADTCNAVPHANLVADGYAVHAVETRLSELRPFLSPAIAAADAELAPKLEALAAAVAAFFPAS
jgi:hypothetical protein